MWIPPEPARFGSGRLRFLLPGRKSRLRRIFSVPATILRRLRWWFRPRLGPRTSLRPVILRSSCPRRLGPLQRLSPLRGPRPSTQLPPQGALALLSRQLRPRSRRSRSPRPTRNPLRLHSFRMKFSETGTSASSPGIKWTPRTRLRPLRSSSLSSHRSRPSRRSLRAGPPRTPLRLTRKIRPPKLPRQRSSAWDLRTSAACSWA